MLFGPLFKRNNKQLKFIGVIVLSALFLLSFTFSGVMSNSLFKANSLVNIKHAPFDGLVFPYSYGVDWVRLSGMGVDRLVAYNEVPASARIEPLIYNARELAIPIDSLGFSRADDIRIRNSKITYTVPYVGTYTLDGIEGAGSHPGIDIALPTGTPVVAIGNGVVVKAENQEWGFGKHIVLRHNDFPSFDDPNKLTTYFSSYSHLDSMAVNVGDVVRKGQLIGSVGMTGTASTPHIHFQIDKDTAPWNPFWPFTATEANNEGLSFFEAINRGLGRALVYEHTINPMVYVQKYFSPGNSLVADAGTSDLPTVSVLPEDSEQSETVELTSSFDFNVPTIMMRDQSYEVELSSTQSLSGRIASLDSDSFNFRSNLISSYSVPRVLDFSSGPVRISFTPKELGNMNLTFSVNGQDFFSNNIEVRLFEDLKNSDSDLNYINILKESGVIDGYSDNTFRADNLVNKAEAAKIIAESLSDSIKDSVNLININFLDVDRSDWFYDHVRVLASIGAIDTSREYYEPAKPINLAEFLKLTYIAYQIDVDSRFNLEFSEYVIQDEWYSPFVNLALKQEVISIVEAQNLSDSQLRRDVARVIARLVSKFE